MFDANRQYRQDELPGDVFNAGSGAGGNTVNYNGRAVTVGNNGNGTRSLSDLGDWATYNAPKAAAPNPTSATTTQNNMFAQDKNDITDFLGRYKAGIQGAIDDTSAKYQLPDQLNNVNLLNTRIQNLKNNTDNSGAGGYANANQVDAEVNTHLLPQYTTGMTNFLNSQQLAGQERDAKLAPYQTEGNLLNERMARELSGFTTEQQRELDKYVAQLQSNTTLSQAQIQAANQLAVAQKQYQQAIDEQRLKNQYQPLQPGGSLVNTSTGKAYNAP